MSCNAVKLAHYWRNSLKDAVFLQGAFFPVRNSRTNRYEENSLLDKFRQAPAANFRVGRLNDFQLRQIFTTNKQNAVTVTLRPFVYKLKSSCDISGMPQTLLPVFFKAYVSRSGRIYPQKNTLNIARDLLNPFADPHYSFGDANFYRDFLIKHPACGFDYHGDKEADDDDYNSLWQDFLSALTNFQNEILKNQPQDLI